MPTVPRLPTPEMLRATARQHWHHDAPDLLSANGPLRDVAAVHRIANGLRALPIAPIENSALPLRDILTLVPLAHSHWPHYHRTEGTVRLAAWCAAHEAPASRREKSIAIAAWRTATPTTTLRQCVSDVWHGTPWQRFAPELGAQDCTEYSAGDLPAPWHRQIHEWSTGHHCRLQRALRAYTSCSGNPWATPPHSAAEAGWRLIYAPPNPPRLLEALAHPATPGDGHSLSILHALWSLPSISGPHAHLLITASKAHGFRPTARCLLRWHAPSPMVWAGFWDLVGMGDSHLPWLTPAITPALWHPGVTEAQRRGTWGALVSSTQRTHTPPHGSEGLRLAHALWIASEALDAADVSTQYLVAGWRGASHPLVARAARRFNLLAPHEVSPSGSR